MNFLSDSAVVNFIFFPPSFKKSLNQKEREEEIFLISGQTSNNFSDYEVYAYSWLDFCVSSCVYTLKPKD